MKFKRTKRLIFIVIAFLLGLILVFLLSMAGNESKGPIQNVLNKVEQSMLNIEDRYILKKRNKQRRQQLAAFIPISKDINALKNPKGILLGASDEIQNESFEAIINLEDSLKTTFPLIHIYNAWGSKAKEQFPEIAVKTIIELGSVPVITWEPWLSDFDVEDYPGIPLPDKREKGCLAAIANGTYDKYIIEWATAVKNINDPIYIRLAHEMNDPYRYPWGPQNNSPEDFKAAWIHVRTLFKSVGAINTIWIWAPHPAYGNLDAFYPGDLYVDYIGIGVLNFGIATTWSKWWTFDQLIESQYEILSSFHKPIMITEFGSLSVGGIVPVLYD